MLFRGSVSLHQTVLSELLMRLHNQIVGTGLWYVAEAAIILSYPEPGRRGRCVFI